MDTCNVIQVYKGDPIEFHNEMECISLHHCYILTSCLFCFSFITAAVLLSFLDLTFSFLMD